MTTPDNVTPMAKTPAPASYTLDQLRQDTAAAAELAERRGTLILSARLEGQTWRAIADAAGLTELATRQAATRANGGTLPQPNGAGS